MCTVIIKTFGRWEEEWQMAQQVKVLTGQAPCKNGRRKLTIVFLSPPHMRCGTSTHIHHMCIHTTINKIKRNQMPGLMGWFVSIRVLYLIFKKKYIKIMALKYFISKLG